MADNLWTRLIEEVGKGQLEDYLKSKYWPRPDGDFHDGFVDAGSNAGGVLGALAGGRFGKSGAFAGGLAGKVAGAWGAHGAYREGQLIGNIVSHPENWTVDAAGAIVPLMPPSDRASDTDVPNDADARYLRRKPNVTTDPSPAAPSPVPPQRPLSLNEAHLEYQKRLYANQSPAAAFNAGGQNRFAVFPGAFPPTPQGPQGGLGTIAQSGVGSPDPLASSPPSGGTAGWTSSVGPTGPGYVPQSASSPEEPGGLLGMLLDHLRNNPAILDPAKPR